MKRGLFIILMMSLLAGSYLQAQNPDLKETFLEAESYFLFEEYNEALPLYLRIHRADPENNNINYKIGICLLNDPYQKDKSVSYLEEASNDINPEYKSNNFKETSAPLEAFFYLGNAYLINNDIENALKNYRYFRQILDEDIYDVELVEEQIQVCERARKLMRMPVDFDLAGLPETINSRFSDINPIVSGDGKRMVFVSKMQFYDATFFTEKVDGVWKTPRNIIPELGVDGDVYPTCLSWDGNTMIIYRNDEFIGNLYQSRYIDGQWSPMEKLGPTINTKYWESHGSLSKDGNILYFTSNRKGGFGGLDIYSSELQPDGTWGEPVNLGASINTRYNEETPFITENGRYLFFSSYGHFNMGGYDVFYSLKDENGKWGNPINLGYPINTTDNDLFFFPVNNGKNGYFSQYIDNQGYGRHDIYYLTIFSENNPRMYMITGSVLSDKGKITEDDGLLIYLIDQDTGDTIRIARPDLATQSFQLDAPRGEYDLLMRSKTFSDLTQKITISDSTSKSGFRIPGNIELATKPYVPLLLTGKDSRIIVEDTPLDAKAGQPAKIKLKLEKGSTLVVDHFVNGDLVETDTFAVDRTRFTYEFVPEPGENTIKFTMIEENGDRSIKSITVNAASTAPGTVTDELDKKERGDEGEPEIEIAAADSVYEQVQAYIDRLAGYAKGELKSTLDTLNAAKEKIESRQELYRFLESEGIDQRSLNDLRVISMLDNNTEELLKRLKQTSSGELYEYLVTIDPENLGITTAAELISHLRAESQSKGYKQEDIDHAIEKILESPSGLKKTRDELLTYAKGDLYKYIESLNLDSLGIYTSSALLDHLIESSGKAFQPELMIAVLSDMVTDRSLDSFVKHLVEKGPPGLADFLKGIDLKKEGIGSISELIAYLLKNADQLGISIDELELLIIELMAEFTIAPILDADPLLQIKERFSELVIIGGLLLAGMFIFFIFFYRRKKNKEK